MKSKRWFPGINQLRLPLIGCFVVFSSFLANSQINVSSSLRIALPLKTFVLNDVYGFRKHPVTGEENKFHSGIDIKASFDTVYSVLPGEVISVSFNSVIGKYIVINHGHYQSVYGHLSVVFCRVTDLVTSETAIGISGNSGRVTGAHLHFGVKHRKVFINPLYFLILLSSFNESELHEFLKH